jgi:large subunit ribosomal protein L29
MSKVRTQLEQIRDLPDSELVQALDRARDELFRLRLGLYTNQVENTRSVRDKKKEVARILSVIRSRKLGLETQAAGSSAAADTGGEAKEA